jgi:hypothetical protein
MPRDNPPHHSHSPYDRPGQAGHVRRRSRDPSAEQNGNGLHSNGNGSHLGTSPGAAPLRKRYDCQGAFFEKLDRVLHRAESAATLEDLDEIILKFVRQCGLYHGESGGWACCAAVRVCGALRSPAPLP